MSDIQHCPLSGSTSIDLGKPYPNPCVNPRGLELGTTGIIFGLIYTSVNTLGVPDHRINKHGFPTFAGCESVSNTLASQPSWYPGAVIWQRLTNWKLPLLQLFFLTALSTVGKRYRALVLSHLLGNPISSIQDLLLKLSDCQHLAREWQRNLGSSNRLGAVHRKLVELGHHVEWADGRLTFEHLEMSSTIQDDRKAFAQWEQSWKSIAIILVSFQEFDSRLGHDVSKRIYCAMKSANLGGGSVIEFVAICRQTAEALAADRYTTLVPIMAAQIFFIFAIATPFIQIRASAPVTPGLFLNIEAYSIAFSLLFFRMIFTTFLSAIIGVSQSRDRVPRILNRFRKDMQNLLAKMDRACEPSNIVSQGRVVQQRVNDVPQPCGVARNPTQLASVKEARHRLLGLVNAIPTLATSETTGTQYEDGIFSGRIPSWQPGRRDYHLPNSSTSANQLARLESWHGPFSVFIVTLSCGMGFLLAWEVPPHGFECRHVGLISIWFLWILSYVFSTKPILRMLGGLKAQFWYHYIKDTLVALLQSASIILTQCGLLNSCACYSLWGRVDIPLSTIPSVARHLHHNFSTRYAYITFFTIFGYYIILPAIVLYIYRDGARVFLQKDDGRPYFEWLQRKRWEWRK